MVLAVLISIGIFALVVILPLLIYTFLIFPNIDGVMQDIRWYNYDEQSRHYLFWAGFWMLAIIHGLGYGKITNRKDKE